MRAFNHHVIYATKHNHKMGDIMGHYGHITVVYINIRVFITYVYSHNVYIKYYIYNIYYIYYIILYI
jgi:hypothetical protein